MMYLSLLEFTYAVEDRDAVEGFLSQADLAGVLISTEQYDDEILAVLASHQEPVSAYQQLRRHPAISFCEVKRRVVYRVTTITAPKLALSSFPGENSEWYHGDANVTYLSTQTDQLSDKQVSWLAACAQIVAWEYQFDLAPVKVLAPGCSPS